MKSAVRRCLPFRPGWSHAARLICGGLTVATSLGLWLSPLNSRTIDSSRAQKPQFKYAGGTEDVLASCAGTLQLGSDSMTYTCAQYSVTIPYRTIETMQYRADVSRHVRKLKMKWQVLPPVGGGHNNRYFTLVYRVSGAAHVMILEVPNDQMRPYLAEIDLKCGRRVDVQRHEDYE